MFSGYLIISNNFASLFNCTERLSRQTAIYFKRLETDLVLSVAWSFGIQVMSSFWSGTLEDLFDTASTSRSRIRVLFSNLSLFFSLICLFPVMIH